MCASGYQLWLELTDVLLTMLYLGYGMALIRASFRVPEEVRLTDITRVVVAERIAGAMLLMSACIDGALSLDFVMYAGEHASGILSLSYLIFIPAIVVAVVTLGVSTPQPASEVKESTEKEGSADTASTVAEQTARLSEPDAQEIVSRVDRLMKDKEAFLDPDLTLSRLAKKVGIPARQISMAINQIYGQNISKVLNGYRIKYAQMLLLNSEDSITDIYLRSGFQTKSNFNREFMRVCGQTPSAFRRTAMVSCKGE
jgi:AraC-like DNA-binding protein